PAAVCGFRAGPSSAGDLLRWLPGLRPHSWTVPWPPDLALRPRPDIARRRESRCAEIDEQKVSACVFPTGHRKLSWYRGPPAAIGVRTTRCTRPRPGSDPLARNPAARQHPARVKRRAPAATTLAVAPRRIAQPEVDRAPLRRGRARYRLRSC